MKHCAEKRPMPEANKPGKTGCTSNAHGIPLILNIIQIIATKTPPIDETIAASRLIRQDIRPIVSGKKIAEPTIASEYEIISQIKPIFVREMRKAKIPMTNIVILDIFR